MRWEEDLHRRRKHEKECVSRIRGSSVGIIRRRCRSGEEEDEASHSGEMKKKTQTQENREISGIWAKRGGNYAASHSSGAQSHPDHLHSASHVLHVLVP